MANSRTKRPIAAALCGLLLAGVTPAALAKPCDAPASASASERAAAAAQPSARFLAVHEEDWMENFHHDIDAQFPGGRSNHYHDIYTKEAVKKLKSPVTTGWKISNRHFLCDGEWYAVQWLYEATQPDTGQLERESTLGFGRVVDGKLIVWKEYFDDMVGQYQWIGAMPLYDSDEMPYPWPRRATLRRAYRP